MRALLGLLLLTLTLLLLQACVGADPKPWHSARLDAEFTVERADIESFEAYQRLEETLFAQLESEVYAEVATGPEFALVRYSAGSAADPRQRMPDWNRSFELSVQAPRGGVLLLHGLTDAPYSLRALGKSLHARGYQVLGLRLPGHGTAPSGLLTVRWQDMAAAVRLAMAHLAGRVDGRPLHIVGYSTGAPLAVHYALEALEGEVSPIPKTLVLVSPAVGVTPAAALASWKNRLARLPGLGGLAWLQIQPEFDPYKYNSFATNAADQVHRVTRRVARRVAARAQSNPGEVLPPTLVFKSTVDATVSNSALVDQLLGRLAPHRHELVLFDINRAAMKSPLLVEDPARLDLQLVGDDSLPFGFDLVTNEHPDSMAVVSRYARPFSSETTVVPLEQSWPAGVISLSHVALPIPRDDPLYGARPPDNEDLLFLGQMDLKGERGLLRIPSDWLMRLRHNPFYDYLEQRSLSWMEAAGPRASRQH
jgi:alpha-beta hydrolase superfamily lysophospholipase